jgi:hypothetical protein
MPLHRALVRKYVRFCPEIRTLLSKDVPFFQEKCTLLSGGTRCLMRSAGLRAKTDYRSIGFPLCSCGQSAGKYTRSRLLRRCLLGCSYWLKYGCRCGSSPAAATGSASRRCSSGQLSVQSPSSVSASSFQASRGGGPCDAATAPGLLSPWAADLGYAKPAGDTSGNVVCWELDRRDRWEKRQTLPSGKRSLAQATTASTHKHTDTHARTPNTPHTQTHRHARTHAHIHHTHTHTHTHTHARTHARMLARARDTHALLRKDRCGGFGRRSSSHLPHVAT